MATILVIKCVSCGGLFKKTLGDININLKRGSDFHCNHLCLGKDPNYKKKISKANKGKLLGRKLPPRTSKWNANISSGRKLYFKNNPEAREKLRNSNLGKKLSLKTRKKISIAQKGRIVPEWYKQRLRDRMTGSGNPQWKNGIYLINEKGRQSGKYKQWKIAVHKRDQYTCIKCGLEKNDFYPDGEAVIIEANHIKPFSICSEKEKYDINNGETLCHKCHVKTPTYGYRAIKYTEEITCLQSS